MLVESAVILNYVKFGSRALLSRTRAAVNEALFGRVPTAEDCGSSQKLIWISRRVGHCHSRLVSNEDKVLTTLDDLVRSNGDALSLNVYDGSESFRDTARLFACAAVVMHAPHTCAHAHSCLHRL